MYKSKFTINESPVYISDNMSAKMEGIPAISTACTCNPYCLARLNSGREYSICSHCFAKETLNQYKEYLLPRLEDNYKLLNERVLEDDEIPIFNTAENAPRKVVNNKFKFVRIEAFGDVGSVTHALNYLKIIAMNPSKFFGWWSKNYKIIEEAVRIYGKPKNLNLIASSQDINKPTPKDKVPSCFDKQFTVYNKNAIETLGIDINCGARGCKNECGICYTKNNIRIINERLK